MLTTITFDEADGRTTVTIRWTPVDETPAERAVFAANHDSMRGGWTGTFDRLEEYVAKTISPPPPVEKGAFTLDLPSDREIVFTREIAAPRALVFEAWTREEHVRRWYGMCVFELTHCQIDLRVGGSWRYVLRDPATGMDHGFSGEYRTISPPGELVYTERYEPIPGSDHVVRLTFEEQNGGTLLRGHVEYPGIEQRDGHLNSGMEYGMRETLSRLEALTEELIAGGVR